MDFYKNEDYFRRLNGTNREPSISGIQYHVVKDLVTEPVSIEFFKAHVRVDWNTDDNLLQIYLKSARQHLEKWSQLSFGAKEMKLTALRLPANYRLMYGPVDEVTGYENVGDTMLNPPLKNATIEFTTKWEELPEAIKVAICKRAAGDYVIKENYIINEKGTVQDARGFYDEAQKLLSPYRNVTFI